MVVSNIRPSNSQKLLLWLPVVVCMGFIFYMSSIPGSNLPSLFVFQDVLFHFSIYCVLGFFIVRAMRKSSARAFSLKLVVTAILLGTLYGISDELHQGFVSYRSVSGMDVFIDAFGSAIGSLLYR